MKRIPESALTATALAKGATVKVDGKAINAAGHQSSVPRVHLLPRPPAPPAPEPAPASPAPAEIDTSGLERIARAGQQATQQLLQTVQTLLAQQTRNAQLAARPPVRAWRFDFSQDRDRVITMSAEPVEGAELPPGARAARWEFDVEQAWPSGRISSITATPIEGE